MKRKILPLAIAGITLGATGSALAEHAVTTKYGTTTISGKTYVDGTYKDAKYDNGGKQPSTGSGFDVKRFYLTIDQSFNDMISARLRTDVETGDSVSHPNVYNTYVKNAWVQAKFSDQFTLRAGVADLPWIPYVEDLYGYRYVEHVLIDRAHFGTSADLGIHALGKLDNGLIDYQVSVVNGGGYHNVARSSSMDTTARIGFHPTKQITIALGARTGKLGANKYTGSGGSTTGQREATRYDAVAAYVGDTVRLGASGFYADNFSSSIVTAAAPSDKAFGYSVWASYALNEQYAIFGRYDYVRPHDDTNSSMKDNFATVGVQYTPAKPLKISLVYKYNKISQGNGTQVYNATNIKSSGIANNDAKYNEIGVFAQYVF